MGDDCGPIVVARTDGPSSTKGITVAVPGTLTTAFLTQRMYDPQVEYVVMPLDRIQDAVRTGEVAAGLLIHEGQPTYQRESLVIDVAAAHAAIRTPASAVAAPVDMKDVIVRYDAGLRARIVEIVRSVDAAGAARPPCAYELRAVKIKIVARASTRK